VLQQRTTTGRVTFATRFSQISTRSQPSRPISSLLGYCTTPQSTFYSTLAQRVRSSIFPIVAPRIFRCATLAGLEAEPEALSWRYMPWTGRRHRWMVHPLRSRGIYAVDLTHVNEGLVAKGASRVHGVLGVDVLTYRQAVIDYATMSLFLHHLNA
jgi:hypothetical protein